MKRCVLFLPIVLLLGGCTQLFDTNLFENIDSPPALSASALASKSVSEVASMISDESSATTFYEQLQADTAALDAVQSALADDFSTTAVTAATTTAEKDAVVEAATTYLLVTANGSDAAAVVQSAVLEASNLSSGGSTDTAIANLVSGKSEAEITTILNNFLEISTALDAMQDVATTGTTVDSSVFFSDSSSTGEIAQVALAAAAVDALTADYVAAGLTVADLAADLAAGTISNSIGTTNLDALSDALDGSDTNPATNDYAYLAAVTDALGL